MNIVIREKTINISGKPVKFASTAGTLRRYRHKFHRDLMVDAQKLVKASQIGEMDVDTLEVFEALAYTMAKQGDPTIPDDPDEWLDQFDTFSVYEVMPELIALWVGSVAPIEESKKNNEQLREG